MKATSIGCPGTSLRGSTPAAILGLLGLLGLALPRCHQVAALTPPSVGDAPSVLLLAFDDTSSYEAAFGVAQDGSDGSEPSYPVFERPRDVHLEAMSFSCPLSTLGLRDGQMPLRQTRSERPLLPPPTKVLSSDVSGVVQSAWTERGEPSDHAQDILQRLDVDEDNLCRLYGSRPLLEATPPFDVGLVDPAADPEFLVREGDETALLGATDGSIYRIGSDRSSIHLETPEDLPHGAAYAKSDGQLVIVGTDGRIARGDVETGFDRFEVKTSTTYYAIRVDGSKKSTDPFEIFLVSSSGNLERFNGEQWELLSHPDAPRSALSHSHDVIWLGPGEALATGVGPDPGVILHFQAGSGLEELRLGSSAGRPTSVAHFDTFGTFVGTATGNIARFEGDHFELMTPPWPDDAIPPNTVRVFMQGWGDLIFGMENFARLDPHAGLCPFAFKAVGADEVADLSDGVHLLRPLLNPLQQQHWGVTKLATESAAPPCLSQKL